MQATATRSQAPDPATPLAGRCPPALTAICALAKHPAAPCR